MVICFCVFCSSAWAAEKMSLANDKIHSVEELSMTPGEKVDANRFLGNVYLKPMIREGEGLEFPATNLVTFEPKARSAWHRHGGMILLVTDGVGYYQEKGKPAQILRRGDVKGLNTGMTQQRTAGFRKWWFTIPAGKELTVAMLLNLFRMKNISICRKKNGQVAPKRNLETRCLAVRKKASSCRHLRETLL